MSDNKKASLCKPPVPERPKNLVILNSKHLPKPPETFSPENITNFIKDLNLDVKYEGNKSEEKSQKLRCEGSDGEEEPFGYLEPITLHPLSLGHQEDDSKCGDVFRKVKNKNITASSGANLGRRLSHEMAEFGFHFKRRLRRSFESQPKIEKSHLEVISEVYEFEEIKPGSQWQRPLPSLPLPPAETKSVVATMPWYKNVNRKKGEEILRNGVNGYFLVRPSSNVDTYLTLTLWHGNRVYNIPIRRRKDGKFALGTPKTHEQCFDSVEYLVKNYQSEKLVLYSNGVQTGKTLLTAFPP